MLAFFASCLVLTSAARTKDIESVNFSTTVSGHKIEATLSSKAFDPRRHKIIILPTAPLRIDGKRPFGIVTLPDAYSEFSRFEVLWDGKPVYISRSLYSDCFNPNLDRKQGWWDLGDIYFLPSKDGLSLHIEMKGADCAGSYFACWVISRNGKHARFIDDEIP